MKREELETILKNHKLWLNHEGGERANLRKADLQYANLRKADLQYADLQYADLQYADLRNAYLQYADLQYADLRNAYLQYADLRNAALRNADLRNAYLRYADLQYADLDYSCLPLWCGSRGMIVDKRIAAQIAAHFCALSCDDPDFQKARAAIIDFALTSHRADDLGLMPI